MITLEPPVQFFLEHRKEIEEWYALRNQAAVAADRFFATLNEPVKVLAGELGTNVEHWIDLANAERRVALYQKDWKQKKGSMPFVAIGFFWAKTGLFDSGWSGIWANVHDELGNRISEPLRQATGKIDLGKAEHHEKWWPTWSHERPQNDRFWVNDEYLEEFRKQLVASIRTRWELLHEIVISAVEKARQS